VFKYTRGVDITESFLPNNREYAVTIGSGYLSEIGRTPQPKLPIRYARSVNPYTTTTTPPGDICTKTTCPLEKIAPAKCSNYLKAKFEK